MQSLLKKLVVLLACFIWGAEVRAEPLVSYETFTLKNGLQFILLQNKRAPIVSYTTWFRVGSADEVSGKTGIAHYLEHLMESALPEVQMGQFLEDFQSSGTHSNAFTSQDYTFYYKMVTTDKLELLMRYEAGRMRGVAFNEDKFRTEKNVILEERLMRTDNDPHEFFSENFNVQFFGTHPYKNPVIGWEKDIRALTLQDIKAFHKKWYTPSNAFIIISGDFDPKVVRTWVNKYYADLPSGKKTTRARSAQSLDHAQRPPVHVHHPRTPETVVSLSYPLPNLKHKSYKDALALLLLIEYLNGDFEGSLQNLLVHSKKLATTFQSTYPLHHFLDAWAVVFQISPTDDKNIQQIINLIHEKLSNIARDGLKEEEIDRARIYLYNSLIMTLDDIYQKASFVGNCLSSGLTLAQINTLPEDLKKVTSADIQRVIELYLNADKALMGTLKKSPSSNTEAPK